VSAVSLQFYGSNTGFEAAAGTNGHHADTARTLRTDLHKSGKDGGLAVEAQWSDIGLIYLFRDFPLSDSEETLVTGGADEFCYNLMNYIDTHVFTLKNLEELADMTNYNYSYLSSLFRKTTGRTLLDYYGSCRLRVARSLIRENKMKIGEIAELLNYSSVYSFSKAYKNKYGISPTETRKK